MHLHVPHRHAPGSGKLSGRAWAWMHQFELDRQLADGADTASSPALKTRARQLRTPHFREALVAELDTVLVKAEHPPHWHSPSLPVRSLEVHAARGALGALRQALAAPGVPCVQGIALAACLIHDPGGPLYHACASGDIGQLARQATVTLTAAPPSPAHQVGRGQPPCL